MNLVETYSLNSVDAMVLRSALDVAVKLRSTGDTLVFVASDQRLLRAASNKGLLIFNPEINPEQTLETWSVRHQRKSLCHQLLVTLTGLFLFCNMGTAPAQTVPEIVEKALAATVI